MGQTFDSVYMFVVDPVLTRDHLAVPNPGQVLLLRRRSAKIQNNATLQKTEIGIKRSIS